MRRLANAALDAALTGFEFAAGIPGTLGGAVVMNAGAYGGEMKDDTDKCQGYDRRGRDHGASGRRTGTRIPYKHYPGEKIYRFGCRDFAYRRQKRRNKSADG